MLSAKKTANREPARYATGSDFCRIFKENMNGLYLLSFLLTGDHVTAEKCFVQGLDDSRKGNRVFREWARSWARRTIIQNAIQLIRPRPTDTSTSSSMCAGQGSSCNDRSCRDRRHHRVAGVRTLCFRDVSSRTLPRSGVLAPSRLFTRRRGCNTHSCAATDWKVSRAAPEAGGSRRGPATAAGRS